MNKETKTKRRRAGRGPRVPRSTPSLLSLVLNLWYEFIIFRNTGMLETNVKVRSRTRRTGNPPNCAKPANSTPPLRAEDNLGDPREISPALLHSTVVVSPQSDEAHRTFHALYTTDSSKGSLSPDTPVGYASSVKPSQVKSSQAVRGRESALSAVQCVHAQMALL